MKVLRESVFSFVEKGCRLISDVISRRTRVVLRDARRRRVITAATVALAPLYQRRINSDKLAGRDCRSMDLREFPSAEIETSTMQ